MYIGYDGDRKMEPEMIKEALIFIEKHRTSSEPFDVAFYGETPLNIDDAMETIKPYVDSGVTWWLESNDRSFDEVKERIRAGPPKFKIKI